MPGTLITILYVPSHLAFITACDIGTNLSIYFTSRETIVQGLNNLLNIMKENNLKSSGQIQD